MRKESTKTDTIQTGEDSGHNSRSRYNQNLAIFLVVLQAELMRNELEQERGAWPLGVT